MTRTRVVQLVAAIAVVFVCVGVVVFVKMNGGSSPGSTKTTPAALTTINCIGGSEKTELMADPGVQKILHDKYGLVVNFTPLGSYKMIQMTPDDLQKQAVDCLWPSSASAQSIFEAKNTSGTTTPASIFKGYRTATVLQSPEVIYAGPQGTAALVKAGVVKQQSGQYYIVNLKSLLLDYILKGTTWGALGASGISGPIKISSSDPATSNSAVTLAQLELTILSTDDVGTPPSETQARKGLPIVRQLYDTQGLQAASSDSAFEQWLLHGAELGAPLFAGYENQLTQQMVKASGDAGTLKQLQDNVNVLYPQPTIYNDHPVLALDANAGTFIKAMQDPAVQTIAWKQYGFRSGTTIGLNNVADFKSLGLDTKLAQTIQTTAAPNAAVTTLLLDCLQQNKCS